MEGIGNSFFPETLNLDLADGIIRIPCSESKAMVRMGDPDPGSTNDPVPFKVMVCVSPQHKMYSTVTW